MLNNAAELILGKHPNNTFLSYNWHNVRHINKFIKSCAELQSGKQLDIADIGGGKSPYYPVFAEISKTFTAVDLEESLPADEQRSIIQVVGFAEDIPLDSASVDIVLCNQVLEHVADAEKTCEEIFRILRPGGILIGSVPHVSPVHLEPHDHRRYTRPGLQKLLKTKGFYDIHIEGNCGVFSTASFIIAMDMIMSRCEDNKPQRIRQSVVALTFPLVGILNLIGLAADKLFGDRRRTPSNLCWTAVKPSASV